MLQNIGTNETVAASRGPVRAVERLRMISARKPSSDSRLGRELRGPATGSLNNFCNAKLRAEKLMVDWGTLPKQEPRRSSVCFIVDGNVEVSESVTRAVRECGVEPCSYSDTDGLQEVLSKQAPEALILEVSLASPDAVEIIRVLGNCGYEGRVQLVSNCTNELLDAIRRIGERYKLNMLPILPKLFRPR